MWWLWAVFATASAGLTVFTYWWHLPDDLWDTDPHGLVMAFFSCFTGFLVGCPTAPHPVGKGRKRKRIKVDWIRIVGASLLFALVVASAVMSFDWCPDHLYTILYYSLVAVILVVTTILARWNEHVPNAIIMALSVAPFSLLFLGSMLNSPYLDVSAAIFSFACLYTYLTQHRNIDISSSMCSSYLLSCFLIYGLLASPEALRREFKAPFFRVIGANDTVLKYTVAGLLIVVWLFRSLVSDGDVVDELVPVPMAVPVVLDEKL